MTDRAQDVFLGALDVPEPEREAWIAQRCADAPSVAAEVRALLVADRRAEGFLEPPSAPSPSDDRGRWLEGRTIGSYAIVRRIGIGGMGTVYEAMQTRPHRKVALKLLRAGLVTPELRRRFEQEAEILGRLRHPAIAEIYEAGTYDSELGPIPFFALEYIEGARTLAQHATEAALDPAAMVSLVVEICEAVQHGHEQHVVHRDIKPSNILIGDDGRPRLIDFGVARATDDDSRRVTLATAVGELVGTLLYMSPEQCAFDGSTLDGRTDVYSLGVVLYELLAGRLPYPVEGMAPAMIPELVRGHAPAPPLRGTAERWPDLDAVVLTALEKQPIHRYASAAAFADDLRRALRGEPVHATRSRRMYRLRRLWWRGRRALPLAVMIAGVGLGAWSLTRTAPPGATPSEQVVDARERYRHRIAVAERARDADDLGQAKRALEDCPADERDWEWWRLRAQLDDSVAQHRLDAPIDALAYDAQHRRLAAVSEAGMITVLAATDDGVPPRFEQAWQHASGDSYLAIAIDDAHVFVGGDLGRVHVYDAADGSARGEIAATPSSIWGIAVVEEPHGLLISRTDGSLQRWDLADGRMRYSRALGEPLGRLAIDGDRWVAVAGATGILLGDTGSGQVHARMTTARHAEAVLVDARGVVAGGWQRRVDAFDVEGSAEAIDPPLLPAAIVGLARLGDATLAVAGTDGVVRLWDRRAHTVVASLRGHDFGVRTVVAEPGGRWLASGSTDETVRIWASQRAALDTVLVGAAETIHALAWSDGGTRLTTGGGVQWDRSDANELITWSVADGRMLARADDHAATITAVATNDAAIASSDRDGVVVLRADDLAPRRRIAAHQGAARALAWSAERVLASAGDDGRVALWRPDGEPLTHVDAGIGRVHAVAWHGRTVVAVGEHGIARWHPGEGAPITTAVAGLLALAIADDGDLLVGDEHGMLIRRDELGERWRIDTLARSVHGLAIAPGGTRVAVAGEDGRVRLFDARDGAALSTVGSHGDPVTSVAFSPDGSALASGGFDLQGRIWRAPRTGPTLR